jgi:TetR/AcrR family transcriptional regulator
LRKDWFIVLTDRTVSGIGQENRAMSAPAPQSTAVTQSAGELAILDAAERLFSESGYDGVSMRRIAESAGVSKANIYHHFASKEALYFAIMRRSAMELTALLENLAEGKGPFQQRLQAFAGAHLEHLFDNAARVRLVLREALSGDEQKSRTLVEQVLGGIVNRMVAIFDAGQRAGLLRDDLDPGLCATLLMGADLFYFQVHGLLRQIPEAAYIRQPDHYSQQMTDVLLNGMLADPGQGRAAP